MSKRNNANIARTIRPAAVVDADVDEFDTTDTELDDDQYDGRYDDDNDADEVDTYTDADTDDDEYDDDGGDGDDQDDDAAPGGSWEPEMRKNRAARRAEGRRRSGTRVPADAKRPRDRQPKRAPRRSAPQREAEADPGEVVELRFGGRKFTIPADMDDWPTLAHQAFAKQLHYDALEHLLGPQQWALLVTSAAKTKRDFVKFSNMVAREFGFGTAGN